MASKYRLESLEIEGFKAFSNKQKIILDSRPTFIFGENGKGKSSIIEAIVWCLYGTDKAVRNRLYDGVCSVAIYLVEKSKPEDRWRVYRRMHQADNESERGVKPQTLNHVIYDIEAWSRFLGQPMTIPRFKQSARAEPWIPTDDEVRRIMETATRSGDRAISARNRCVIDVLFAGGLRIGELIKLNLSDLDGNLLSVLSEKGEAPRVIGLPPSVTERLQEYIDKYRSQTDKETLFTTTVGRLNYNYARNMVKSIAREAGVPKFHAHAARH